MQTLGRASAMVFATTWAYGYACLLLPHGRRPALILAVLTLGLSLGGLTLVMFWIALLWPGRLGLGSTLAVCAVFAAVGWGLSIGDWRPDSFPYDRRASGSFSPIRPVATTVIFLVAVAVMFNAVYWPFGDTDALAIYAPLAKRIYLSAALPVGNLYEGYPMLLPLAYAYTHWAAGGINEYAARFVPALMAVAALAAAAALGREMRSPRAGLMAAGLVALTPMYCRWSSSGYADVPAAFFFLLTGLAGWRWLTSHSWRDALSTGICAGLAIWTKSDGLTLLLSLAAIGVLGLRGLDPHDDSAPPLRIALSQVGAMAALVLAIAGPWYARNLSVFGFFLPSTAWTNLARHDAASVAAMLTNPAAFSLPGWLFTAAILYALIRSLRPGAGMPNPWSTLLSFVVPFFAAWWWLASYDVRFLVTIVPLLAVMGAMMVDDGLEWIRQNRSRAWLVAAEWLCAAVILAAAPFALQRTVDNKRAILQDPWMGDTQKHITRLGGPYELALAINQLPAGSRVMGVLSPTLYYVDPARLNAMSQALSDAAPWSLAPAYDYVAYDFHGGPMPAWSTVAIPLVQTADGYYLYSTQPPSGQGGDIARTQTDRRAGDLEEIDWTALGRI